MFGSVFLMNLLCAMVPCDYKNPVPEIEGLGPPAGPSNLMGYFRGKRLSPFPAEMYPVVQTGSGKVKGYPMMVMSGRKVTAFEGIPYADAAVRFQVRRRVNLWLKKNVMYWKFCYRKHSPSKTGQAFGKLSLLAQIASKCMLGKASGCTDLKIALH